MRNLPLRIYLWILVLLFLSCLASSAEEAEKPEKPKVKPAKIRVTGYGVVGNLELRKLLRSLQGKERPEFLPSNFIEDAALILISRVNGDGFLKPLITAELTLESGEVVTYEWNEPVEEPLPRTLRVRAARFQIRRGVRYHFESIRFTGETVLTEARARAFFIETGTLLLLKANRIYTPERLNRGIANLRETLRQRGYENPEVKFTDLKQDDHSGAVNVVIDVKPGPQSMVRSIQGEIIHGEKLDREPTAMEYREEPYSRLWSQDYVSRLRKRWYHRGYPDAEAEIKVLKRELEPGTNRIDLDMAYQVTPGPQIHLGKVDFRGNKHTRDSVLHRRVEVEQGDLLNRVAAEEGRQKLARLGVFDSVDLTYDSVGANTRDVVYTLDEAKRLEVSLLFGYGSYELLRGGFEIEHNNIWGRAHHARLRAVQSFKSSSADYLYSMPELLGEDVDVFLNLSGLVREEVSFTREEYGGGVGARRRFSSIASDLSVSYNYDVLRAADVDPAASLIGVTNANVATITTDFRHDRRDNPLYPQRGYKVFASLEVSSDYIGSEVNYERMDLAASYHRPLGGGRWLHFGASHGAVWTVGAVDDELPFNRRFFPGGENSIRGYQQGEAAPLDIFGNSIGAETYLLFTIEFEQALTRAWSIVVFSDSLGFARSISDYPFNEELYSIGAGVRWKTLVGPVRLEYGYNLNPRPEDPTGTLHFSLGFPF